MTAQAFLTRQAGSKSRKEALVKASDLAAGLLSAATGIQDTATVGGNSTANSATDASSLVWYRSTSAKITAAFANDSNTSSSVALAINGGGTSTRLLDISTGTFGGTQTLVMILTGNGMILGLPSGSTKGAGTINVTGGYYVQGVAVPAYNTASDGRVSLLIDQRSTAADVNSTVTNLMNYLGYTTLTAARTVTLPAASAFNAGQRITIADETGNCSATLTLTINRAGSDTINGLTSYVLSNARSSVTLVSDGVSGWLSLGTVGASLSNANEWTGVQTFDSGKLVFKGSSSGTTTVNATAVASGVLTLPAVTDTIAVLATSQTHSATQTFSGTLNVSGTFQKGGFTFAFPGAADTLGGLGTNQSWTGTNTFVGNGNIIVKGSAGGGNAGQIQFLYTNFGTTQTLLAGANSGGNSSITLPLSTTTLAGLAIAETFTALQTFSAGISVNATGIVVTGSSGGGVTITSSGTTPSGTLTLPNVTGTLAVTNVSQTISATQTYSGTLNVSGTFQAGGNTMTFPASAATLGGLSIAQTWSAVNTYNAQTILKGTNTNGAPGAVAGVVFQTGRQGDGTTLASGQTVADISFDYGATGWRHYIKTWHAGTANSATNRLEFYINTSSGQTTSSAPGTGNIMELAITGHGTINGAATGADKGQGTLNSTGLFVNGTAVAVTSDERLKEAITDTTTHPLRWLGRVRVVDYTPKLRSRLAWVEGGHRQTGFIAQELHKVLPDAVHVGSDDPEQDPWFIRGDRMMPHVVLAMQHMQKTINMQAQLLERLTERLAKLELSK